jgi:glucose/arabinose dehydrogenase
MVDHPEQLNLIERGKHFGFPYVFGDREAPNYPARTTPPPGQRFESPVENLGPAGLLGIRMAVQTS